MREPELERWLTIQTNLGLAPNTLSAYRRGIEDFLAFCGRQSFDARQITRERIALYIRDLSLRPVPARKVSFSHRPAAGLANATICQRLTAVRLYYDYLCEEGLRTDNPVGRGRYTPGRGFGGVRARALVPRYTGSAVDTE